jgi:undecaprenyl-diphosphatase
MNVAAGPSTVVVVEPPAAATTRSPTDVLRLIVATVLLLALLGAELWFGSTLVKFTHDLLRGLDAVPAWLLDTIVTATRVLALVVIGGGLVVTLVRGRWRFLSTIALAGALAALLVLVLGPIDPDAAAPTSHLDGLVAPGFPSAFGLAITAAVLAAAAPWLTRRWRRIGWVLILLTTISRFLVAPSAFDSLRGLLIGWFAGAFALVGLGAPSRRPQHDRRVRRPFQLPRARRRRPPLNLLPVPRRERVAFTWDDERSADLLFRMYRRLVPHNLGDERAFSSLRRSVEHEALLALTARSYGVRTPALVALASAEPNAFVLAYERIEGKSLDGVAVDDLTDPFLRAIWTQVADLHRHRMPTATSVSRTCSGAATARSGSSTSGSALRRQELLVDTDRAEPSRRRRHAAHRRSMRRWTSSADALAGVVAGSTSRALSGATHRLMRIPSAPDLPRTSRVGVVTDMTVQ